MRSILILIVSALVATGASGAIQEFDMETNWRAAVTGTPSVISFDGQSSHDPLTFTPDVRYDVLRINDALVFDNKVVDTLAFEIDLQAPIFALGFDVTLLETDVLWAIFVNNDGLFVHIDFETSFFYGLVSDTPLNLVEMVFDGDMQLNSLSYDVVPQPASFFMFMIGTLCLVSSRKFL